MCLTCANFEKSRSKHQFFDLFGRVLLHSWQDVRIRVERQDNRSVSEPLRNYFWIESSRQKQGRRCVPKIVKPNQWKPDLLKDSVKMPSSQVSEQNRHSDLIRKYQIIPLIVRAKFETFFKLIAFVGLQSRNHGLRQRNTSSAFLCFGFCEIKAAAVANLNRASYRKTASFKINIFPLQAKIFAGPQSGFDCQKE